GRRERGAVSMWISIGVGVGGGRPGRRYCRFRCWSLWTGRSGGRDGWRRLWHRVRDDRLIWADRDRSNLLRLTSNNATAHRRLLNGLRQHNGCGLIYWLLLARHHFFALGAFVHTIGNQFIRLRIFSERPRHNLPRACISLDDRWRLAGGRTKQRAIAERTGRTYYR